MDARFHTGCQFENDNKEHAKYEHDVKSGRILPFEKMLESVTIKDKL